MTTVRYRVATLQPWTRLCTGTTRTPMRPRPPTPQSAPRWTTWSPTLAPRGPWRLAASRTTKWAFCRVGPNCCSAENIERKSHASVSPTKTFPTWAITLSLLQRAAIKSQAAFLDVSSSASPFAPRANQKAKPHLLMEEQAHWITDCK